MSVDEKYYLIEYFNQSATPEYIDVFGEDAYDAIASFREAYPNAKIQNVALILSNEIKGSIVEIWRGFLDDNNQIETIDGQQQFFKRYQGITNNVSITENFDEKLRTRVATCIIACASFKNILQNRIAGRYTNNNSWQFFNPSDTSMNRVAFVSTINYYFGKTSK
mgnify:CR=1 FL=1